MLPHAIATLLGAFLLFFCQPMMGRFLLPWFGGGAAVWTVALLFFQAGLVVGYGYAHGIGRLPRRVQGTLHCALLFAAWVALSVVPGEEWRPAPGDDPTLALLGLLTLHIGLPYALLAATAPLIQRWFDLTHPGRSPYVLYAVSNVGALAALVAYPLAEPYLARAVQARLWSWVFLGLVTVFAIAAFRLWSAPDARTRGEQREAAGPRFRPVWFLLPALSSALLLAATNRLTENVPPVPFLWVLPLAIHLASFVVCFARRNLYRRLPVVLVFGAAALAAGWETPGFVWHLLLQCLVLASACLFLHGELYRLRPASARLTGYYLAIAVGGALGGLFVAVVAPTIFDEFRELPLLLAGIGLVVLWTFARDSGARRGGPRTRLAGALLGGVWLVAVGYLGFREPEWRRGTIHRSRNFYGTQSVVRLDAGDPENERLYYRHGTITHGVQYLEATRRVWPTAYFTHSSGVGRLLRSYPGDRPLHIGVVGLGAGTLACYGNAGDRLRFYELDPKVIAVADELFFYLRDSNAEVEVVPGDGRASLEREAPQGFDALVLDAFSGDAPPVHLLTLEAFEQYLRHLKPAGVIAVNVTNVYLDLLAVVATQARELGLAGVWISTPEGVDVVGLKSTWALLARDANALDRPGIRGVAYALEGEAGRVSVWTDERSSPLEVLAWRR